MENIFEYPKETYEHLLRLDRERKNKAILAAAGNNDNSPLSAYTGIGATNDTPSPSPHSKEFIRPRTMSGFSKMEQDDLTEESPAIIAEDFIQIRKKERSPKFGDIAAKNQGKGINIQEYSPEVDDTSMRVTKSINPLNPKALDNIEEEKEHTSPSRSSSSVDHFAGKKFPSEVITDKLMPIKIINECSEKSESMEVQNSYT